MKFAFLTAAGLALAACAKSPEPAASSSADEPCASVAAGEVAVVDAWVRPAAAGQPTSAVYGVICNRSASDDALVGATAAIADAVELHQTEKDAAGVVSMAPLARLPAPANSSAALAPGAAHVMLIGLVAPIEEGATTEVVFNFEKAPPVTVAASARRDEGDHAGH